jgi:hypothetical protein
MDVKDLLSKYIAVRDKKAQLEAAHKAKLAGLNAALEKAENLLLAWFNEHGMDSVGCDTGTAYRTTRTSATVEDRETFFEWVRANEAWHFLESRVAKTQVDEFVTEHQDLPPGIKYTSMVAVNVRRS